MEEYILLAHRRTKYCILQASKQTKQRTLLKYFWEIAENLWLLCKIREIRKYSVKKIEKLFDKFRLDSVN